METKTVGILVIKFVYLKTIKMNLEEVKKTINYLLDNNLNLIERGQHKIAINLIGEAGIGKTAIVQQIAEERGAGYKRIELSSLEEIGDLCGVPVKEYAMYKNNEEKWVTEKVVDRYIAMGWELCESCEPRMNYAVPEWVPKDPEQEFILTLDDYNRATSLFMQATMSLIQFGEYISWKLPKKCHLILSSNPDSGVYSVASCDAAQMSRMINFNVDFDPKVYSKWCDNIGMKDQLINFMLLNPEIFKNNGVNARTYTMFANALMGVKEFESPESLEMISLIGSGCFGETGDVVSSLFVTFVHNHLDKLITPEQMLNMDWLDLQKSLIVCLYEDSAYRADIAATLTVRFCNYVEAYFKDKTNPDKKKSDKVIKRMTELITSPKKLLTEDLIFRMIKDLYTKFPNRLEKLIANPQVSSKFLAL